MLSGFEAALNDFHQARRQAGFEEIMAYLTGKSADLLSYEEVRQKLKTEGMVYRGIQEIPLDAIVGSVDRYRDFTRSFLPRLDSDADRWAKVKTIASGPTGLPPIEVYKIGEVYFVIDGNHRVSVARNLGAKSIEAYVTEVKTKVPLTPDVQPDELICKARYAEFLEKTQLDKLRPGVDLSVTVPAQYRLLEEHIQIHRHFLEEAQQREIPFEEAVTRWYDEIYLPVVRLIRAQGLLRHFPNRTETDLYLWIMEHRLELAEALGWDMSPEDAAADLVDRHSLDPQRVVSRLGEKLLDAVVPDELESGPVPGRWRQERVENRPDGRLFASILVPVSGHENNWLALEQALKFAQLEKATILGLHVIRTPETGDTQRIKALEAEFVRRCSEAGVNGSFSVETGDIVRKIGERTRWADLVAVRSNIPADSPLARLRFGLRTLIQRWSRPVLTVHDAVFPINRALLAYDGSPKAEEALFVGTYLAARRQVGLVVMAVLGSNQVTVDTVARAEDYLAKHEVQATFVRFEEDQPVAATIVKTAADEQCGLIMMGGYGHSPLVGVMFGSVVDEVLELSPRPVLVCR